VNGTCNNLERVSAYHDGELPDAAAAEVERHLMACDECSTELERYRAMSRHFASTELPKLSASAKRRLRRALDDERAAGRLRIVRALTAVAASIFLVTASHLVHQQGTGSATPPAQPGGMPSLSVLSLRGDVPGLLPASTAPESSFAQFMVDGLEKGND
jgi:anti-sigma factor RsiW